MQLIYSSVSSGEDRARATHLRNATTRRSNSSRNGALLSAGRNSPKRNGRRRTRPTASEPPRACDFVRFSGSHMDLCGALWRWNVRMRRTTPHCYHGRGSSLNERAGARSGRGKEWRVPRFTVRADARIDNAPGYRVSPTNRLETLK